MSAIKILLAKYGRGIVAFLSFLSVVLTAFLSAYGNALPAQWTAWIAGVGTLIGGVLSFLQHPNPLNDDEKARVRAVFRPGNR